MNLAQLSHLDATHTQPLLNSLQEFNLFAGVQGNARHAVS